MTPSLENRSLPGLMVLALPVVLIGLSCTELAQPPEVTLKVSIAEPIDGDVFSEGELVRLEASVAAEGDVEFDLSDTVIVWYSDVVGVLSSEVGDCAPVDDSTEGDDDTGEGTTEHDEEACWLIYPAVSGGEMIWPLVTRLSAGTHVITARAIDAMGGRATPASASVVITVKEVVPPEAHLVEPADGAELVTGEEFTLSAWISDDQEGEIEVIWSSSVQGLVDERLVEAPDVYEVSCTAGGVGEPGDLCHLSPGTHVMVLVAIDGDGGESHTFLTLKVVGPDEEEEG